MAINLKELEDKFNDLLSEPNCAEKFWNFVAKQKLHPLHIEEKERRELIRDEINRMAQTGLPLIGHISDKPDTSQYDPITTIIVHLDKLSKEDLDKILEMSAEWKYEIEFSVVK